MKYRIISFLFLILVAFGCKKEVITEEITIAFLADVHFQDIYAKFPDADYQGIENPKTGEHVNIRTMQSQLGSTRIFNENYFAFLEALDDIASKNIKYVVLPGDFSDDGQPVHIKGLKRILDSYTKKYGLQFLLITGNHDPMRPYTRHGGKADFIGTDGKQQPIFSNNAFVTMHSELPPIISQEIKNWGYVEIMEELKVFGFLPKKSDLYWETPFTTYSNETYDYYNAIEESDVANRNYVLSDTDHYMIDASYLVEPEEGLWFLALDGNVYPRKSDKNLEEAASYKSASIGYNNLLTEKPFLFDWIKSVTQRAKKLNKTLIVFSHYPILDFHNGASPQIMGLLVKDQMQSHRIPNSNVARTFLDAGIKVHFGGHIHINDTEVFNSEKGQTLVNVQVPSLASYMPSYKMVTVSPEGNFEIETVKVNAVERFDELFDLYRMEYLMLESNGEHLWDKDILKTSDYHEFTSLHLKGLVNERFMEDWPDDFKTDLMSLTGKNMVHLLGTETSSSLAEIDDFKEWTIADFIFDIYRLRNADNLAINDIGHKRTKQYQYLANEIKTIDNPLIINEVDYKKELKLLFAIFTKFSTGKPVSDFTIVFDSRENPKVVPNE